MYDEFVEKSKARALKRVVGDPFKEGVEQGPQVCLFKFILLESLSQLFLPHQLLLYKKHEEMPTFGTSFAILCLSLVNSNLTMCARLAKKHTNPYTVQLGPYLSLQIL